MTVWENGWSQARWREMQHLGCLRFIFEISEDKLGFPSAPQTLYSYPSTRVLMLKLLKSFPFLLIRTFLQGCPVYFLTDVTVTDATCLRSSSVLHFLFSNREKNTILRTNSYIGTMLRFSDFFWMKNWHVAPHLPISWMGLGEYWYKYAIFLPCTIKIGSVFVLIQFSTCFDPPFFKLQVPRLEELAVLPPNTYKDSTLVTLFLCFMNLFIRL